MSELARAVLGEDTAGLDRDDLVSGVRDDVVDALGQRADGGARAHAAAVALQTLARAGEACDVAGVSGAERAHVERLAEARREAAVELALAPIADALADASARGDLVEHAHAILAELPSIWRWSGDDEAVERFAVDRVTEVAWDLYRAARWDDLRDLLHLLEPLVENLSRRIERGDGIAYGAPCAQMLVFRSEVARTLAEQIELAELALALCPGHKNARIVLASYLCHDAMRRMNRAHVFSGPEERAAIGALLARASRSTPPPGLGRGQGGLRSVARVRPHGRRTTARARGSLFDVYGIDPHAGPNAITERFRELMEDARDDAERDALRGAWESLTLHPMDRWRAALQTHPDVPPPPVQPNRKRRPSPATADFGRRPPTLADLSAGTQVSCAFPMLDDTLPAEPPLANDPAISDATARSKEGS